MYEYKVVPAPAKGVKAKGVKTAEARFALAIEQAINTLAADGWQYQRSDVLPSDERQGLTGSVKNWRTLLVFRRPVPVDTPEDTAQPTRTEPVLTANPPRLTEDTDQPPTSFEEGNEETRPA